MIPLLLLTHVLLLVAWVGVDAGVFIGSFVWTRRGMSLEARQAVRSLTQILDLGPRLSLVLFVPAGTALAYASGLGLTGVPPMLAWTFIAVLVALALVWSWFVIAQLRLRMQGRTNAWLVRHSVTIDRVVRVCIAVAAITTAVPSLWTGWPWATHTVAVKVLLFGLVLVASLRIRTAVSAYLPIWEQIVRGGETPELIDALRREMSKVRAAVLMVYAGLWAIVTVAFVGVP